MSSNTHVASLQHLQNNARRTVRLTYLPVVLIGANAIGWTLASRGAPTISVVGLLLAVIAVSFISEAILPYERSWLDEHGDRMRDALHAMVNEGLQMASLFTLPLLVELLAIDGAWPTSLPFAVQVIGALIVVDAGITIGHWVSHRRAVLWRFHAVHHSVERFYGFNGLMKHPLHQLFETAVATTPLVILGLPEEVATAVVVSVSVQLLLQHSNVDYAVGPLRGALALNHLHRFHHLRTAAEGDVNFGLFTTLWDRILGTATWDRERRFTTADIGIAAEPDYPRSYVEQLAKPFRRPARPPMTDIV